MSYLPCELHCHTVHSDGDFLTKELLQAAKDDHLALIALTDHNTSSGCDELDDSITPAIRGIEWTTYFGHMLVLGARGFVDWRDAVPENIDKKINQVKEKGGVVGVAHPFQLGSPMCTGGRWEFNVRNWQNVDYMEIWHEAFSFENYENDKAMALWTSLLDKGFHIACTYGRDWHRPITNGKHYGCTYIDIDGEINEPNALKAIRMGKTVASTGAKLFFRVHQKGKTYNLGETLHRGMAVFSFFLDLHSRQKNEGSEKIEYKSIKLITNEGRCVMQTAVTERHIRVDLQKNHWYRAELWGTVNGVDKILAVTSPVYTA
ncbi:MAG: CehA/McbA family metallohydrolase [Eubacterium sp.]